MQPKKGLLDDERTTIVPPKVLAGFARQVDAEASHKGSEVPAPSPTDRGVDALEREMFDHLAARDYPAALRNAETILEEDPAHTRARTCAGRCHTILEARYVHTLGSLTTIFTRSLDDEVLRAKTLDPRAGFVLSLVDGASDLETLLDASAMPRLDALRLLYELCIEGVIAADTSDPATLVRRSSRSPSA